MFGGVTEGMGRIISVIPVGATGRSPLQIRLTIDVPASIVKNLSHGGSVAVNGVCLSAVLRRGKRLTFDVIGETLSRTTIGGLQAGDRVNVERPLRYGSRIEGHCVLGHIDGTAIVEEVRAAGRQKDFRVRFPKKLKRWILEKGSVALDGVSLTVGKVEKDAFWIHCIPVTLKKTTFGFRAPGDRLNLEADWLVKSLRGKGSRRLDFKLPDRLK